ncbi:MAG: hypothetical protein WDN00_14160 [Limisphaerales bacterium]
MINRFDLIQVGDLLGRIMQRRRRQKLGGIRLFGGEVMRLFRMDRRERNRQNHQNCRQPVAARKK